MIFGYIVIALLPAIAFSSIDIRIKVDKGANRASVKFSGTDEAIISDQERKAFQLTDRALKKSSQIYGKQCTDIFLKRPTPWADVYRKFGWEEVKRRVSPVSARVLAINAKPTAVATAEYVNHHKNIKAKYSTSLQQNVDEEVSNTWSKGGELTVEQEINYGVNFGEANVGGKTSFSYTGTWGNDTTKSRTITLGTTSTVEVEIPPGGGVLATLSATRGTIEIEVEYEAIVDGDVFCNYHGGFNGHMWWAYPLHILQQHANLPRALYSTERISIGFYTNARIVVSNLQTNAPIKKVPAGVINVLHGFNGFRA